AVVVPPHVDRVQRLPLAVGGRRADQPLGTGRAGQRQNRSAQALLGQPGGLPGGRAETGAPQQAASLGLAEWALIDGRDGAQKSQLDRLRHPNAMPPSVYRRYTIAALPIQVTALTSD